MSSDERPRVEARRSKHTTTFSRITSDKPQLYGKRPHLAKAGREVANAAAAQIQNENPDWVDADDVKLADVLKWLNSPENSSEGYETATLCDLLTQGLTFREAVTFYLYEHAGLTLREIYHVDEGKQRSFSRENDRQAERNVAATIESAAEKLGVDVDVVIQ